MIIPKSATNENPEQFQRLRISVALLSLIFTILAIVTDDVLNVDGVLYVEMAEAFITHGLAGTANLYNWPFYSILAAFISQITGLSSLYSFYALNILLFILVTDACLCLTSTRIKNSIQLTIAAIIILCLFSLNEYRDFIIRDIGYWAFSLYAVYHFIAYLKTYKTQHLLLWQITIVIAILFRVEGLILLALLPLTLFFQQTPQRLKAFFISYAWILVLGLSSSIFYILTPSTIDAFSKLSDITSYMDWQRHWEFLINAANLIDEKLIHPLAQDQKYGAIIIAFGFCAVTITEILSALSIPYVLLSIISFSNKRAVFNLPYNSIFLSIFFIQFSLLLIFFITKQLQTTRYCLLAGIILLIWWLPAITTYIQKSFEQKQLRSILFICLILLYSAVDAFHHTGSKEYIISDSSFAAKSLPKDSIVITNNRLIGFYLKQSNKNIDVKFRWDFRDIEQSNYLFLETHRVPQKQLKNITLHWDAINQYGTKKRPIILYKKRIEKLSAQSKK